MVVSGSKVEEGLQLKGDSDTEEGWWRGWSGGNHFCISMKTRASCLQAAPEKKEGIKQGFIKLMYYKRK